MAERQTTRFVEDIGEIRYHHTIPSIEAKLDIDPLFVQMIRSMTTKLLTHPAANTHAISSVTTPTFRLHGLKKSLMIHGPDSEDGLFTAPVIG